MSQAVHDMFAGIASRYDLANDVLSFGIHRLWRRAVVREVGPVSGKRIVDLCTGTGDLAFTFARAMKRDGQVVGVDFVQNMLRGATKKSDFTNVFFVRGDAQRVPLPDETCDAATIAFGIRNVDDPSRCLREVRRLLVPGGKAVVLEFGQPTVAGFRHLYAFYSSYILPLIGWVLTGDLHAYSYLNRTASTFPAGERFVELMKQAGFVRVRAKPLFGGVAYIYSGES
jgi:demethylmenaquinone methyltransferase/2-methoxy-6-polyprenyl-1,4-benzoquinol methylase